MTIEFTLVLGAVIAGWFARDLFMSWRLGDLDELDLEERLLLRVAGTIIVEDYDNEEGKQKIINDHAERMGLERIE